jgi:hypothetical protein
MTAVHDFNAPDLQCTRPLQVLFVHLGNGTDELYFSPHKKKILGSSARLCETAIVPT